MTIILTPQQHQVAREPSPNLPTYVRSLPYVAFPVPRKKGSLYKFLCLIPVPSYSTVFVSLACLCSVAIWLFFFPFSFLFLPHFSLFCWGKKQFLIILIKQFHAPLALPQVIYLIRFDRIY